MSWKRSHYKKERKQVRHARVSLCSVQCLDCRRELRATYLVVRFQGRCRACWDGFVAGVAEMASHYERS
ncbi:MAG TPA: hypothetical protein VFB60_24070 [Ktedonobacteraceae bacterium]|nr:hypothetical protein [Ktedonobacteraceae bacterium]